MVSIAGRFSVRNLGAYSMSKHALISFTDVLRQEVSLFGIKVASIEPALVKTKMMTMETLAPQIEIIWNQTSDDVKKLYGGLSQQKSQLKTLIASMQPIDPELVMEDVVDSIINEKPRANYRPIAISMKLMYILNMFASTEIVDAVLVLVEKIIPFMSILTG